MVLEWQRAKTTRRYIHPPKAERMYTLWADGKIIYGDIDYNPGPSKKTLQRSCVPWGLVYRRQRDSCGF